MSLVETCRELKNIISGIMHITFTNPEPNVLRVLTEERVKGWKFNTTLTFSPMGKRERENRSYTQFGL